MIRLALIPAALLLLSACGQSNEDRLEEAANQSDPAAAAVLNGAAENGMNAQDALEQAGQSAADADNGSAQNQSLQARPNLPQSPNRPEGGEPPEKSAAPVEGGGNSHGNHSGNSH